MIVQPDAPAITAPVTPLAHTAPASCRDAIARLEGFIHQHARRTARHLPPSLIDAEDVAQEYALQILIGEEHDQARGALTTWACLRFGTAARRLRQYHYCGKRSALRTVPMDNGARGRDGGSGSDGGRDGVSLAMMLADPRAEDPATAAERAEEELQTHHQLARAMEGLTRRQRAVLEHRYGLHGRTRRTLANTARALKVTRNQAAHAEQSGMRELRKFFGKMV